MLISYAPCFGRCTAFQNHENDQSAMKLQCTSSYVCTDDFKSPLKFSLKSYLKNRLTVYNGPTVYIRTYTLFNALLVNQARTLLLKSYKQRSLCAWTLLPSTCSSSAQHLR